MLEDLQFDHPPNLFHGVRFILCGFDPISKSQVYFYLYVVIDSVYIHFYVFSL